MNQNDTTLVTTFSDMLDQSNIDWKAFLTQVVSSFHCTTGTLHFLDAKTSLLQLEAYIGIPEFLLPKLSEIAIGKGMAGIAAERRQPIEMCNLQTDNSGVARPAAKETKVEGSIAVPLLLNDELYGTLGIAKPVSYDFTDKEKIDLLEIGGKICRRIKRN